MSEKKELTIIKGKTTRVLNKANELEVSNSKQFDYAANILSDIKAVSKIVKADKEKLTKPLNEALKEARGRYKPLEEELKSAEAIVKDKLSVYQEEVDAKLKEEEAELKKKLADGDISPEDAVASIENSESIGTSYDTDKGSIQFKTVRKVRVTDVTKIPVEYLNNDKVLAAITSAVRQDALDGKEIDGVEVYEDRSVAAV